MRGRLGNHIWAYMEALGLELNYDVEPVIPLATYNYLEPYFKNIRYRVAERDLCGHDEYYKAFLEYLDQRIIEVGGFFIMLCSDWSIIFAVLFLLLEKGSSTALVSI